MSYLIRYYRGFGEESLVEMPNRFKLVLWIIRNAHKYHSVHIIRCFRNG